MSLTEKNARIATISRKTSETDISLEINLDGSGLYDIDTGIGFFDHMLAQLSRHSGIDIRLRCTGDLHIDTHHTVEDVGIALGEAFAEALGDKRGIGRYADTITPMDECLILVALDFSGRGFLKYTLPLQCERLGTLETETIYEFFSGFARSSGLTLHIKAIETGNTHHMIEGTFKGFARSLRAATSIIDKSTNAAIPSTKGTL